MRSIGAYEAKTSLASLLNRVEQGESFTITRHGRAVAVLAPPVGSQTWSVDKVIAELRALRAGTRLGDLSLRDLIEEGRR